MYSRKRHFVFCVVGLMFVATSGCGGDDSRDPPWSPLYPQGTYKLFGRVDSDSCFGYEGMFFQDRWAFSAASSADYFLDLEIDLADDGKHELAGSEVKRDDGEIEVVYVNAFDEDVLGIKQDITCRAEDKGIYCIYLFGVRDYTSDFACELDARLYGELDPE